MCFTRTKWVFNQAGWHFLVIVHLHAPGKIQSSEIWKCVLTRTLVCHNLELLVWSTNMNGHFSPHYSAVCLCASRSLTQFPSYCHPWLPALPSCLLPATPPRSLSLCSLTSWAFFPSRTGSLEMLFPPTPLCLSVTAACLMALLLLSSSTKWMLGERQPWLTPPNARPYQDRQPARAVSVARALRRTVYRTDTLLMLGGSVSQQENWCVVTQTFVCKTNVRTCSGYELKYNNRICKNVAKAFTRRNVGKEPQMHNCFQMYFASVRKNIYF